MWPVRRIGGLEKKWRPRIAVDNKSIIPPSITVHRTNSHRATHRLQLIASVDQQRVSRADALSGIVSNQSQLMTWMPRGRLPPQGASAFDLS